MPVNEDATHRGPNRGQTALINAGLAASVVGILISSIFTLWKAPSTSNAFVYLGGLLLMLGVIYATARSGRVRSASWIFCLTLMTAITFAIYNNGGIRAPSAGGYVIVVLLAGFLLGGRASLLLAFAGVVAGLGVSLLELAGELPRADIPPTPLNAWGTLAAVVLWAVIVLRFYDRSLRDALTLTQARERTLEARSREQETITTELASLNERLTQEIAHREKSDSALVESEELLRSVTDSAPDYIIQLDRHGRIEFINRPIPGWDTQVVGQSVGSLVDEPFQTEMQACFRRVLETRRPDRYEFESRTADGTITHFESRVGPVVLNGETVGMTLTCSDVTESRRTADALARSKHELLQAKKMEAIGILAGGVAHDFNNILTVILGYSELLLSRGGHSRENHRAIEQIDKAAGRASSLTRQLLAFSRRQVMQPRVLDPALLVDDMQEMLSRILGEDIVFTYQRESELGYIKADPGQLQQVFVNLVANARDAMPSGGSLKIAVSRATLSRREIPAPGPPPGDYVLIQVEDDGIGMDASAREHVFDPFFTTKSRGQGTGLGLSSVYGIVKQSGGYIYADSHPGEGSTFRVYLPLTNAMSDEEPIPTPEGRGKETILVVEDDPAVRSLASIVLTGEGYQVLEADNGRKALAIARKNIGRIDLLLTDVVMPEVDGRELADKMAVLDPETRILFMTGYSDETTWLLEMDENALLLHKPFTPASLTQKVHEILDRPIQLDSNIQPAG